MKANELMIGDWVLLFDNTPVKVDCIGNVEVYLSEANGQDWRVTYEHIKPIPITPEILEANGWVHYHPYNKKAEYWQLRGWVDVNIKVNRGHFFFSIYGKPFKETFFRPHFTAHLRYVHELQHALRLCGLDKEIVI